MKIINFSHPLTTKQLEQIENITRQEIDEVITIASQINTDEPLEPQIELMLVSTKLSAEDWQTQPLIINLPALNFSAAIMLAKLHGIMGYFPTILRLKPTSGATPPRFELAEVINLHAIRMKARSRGE